MPVDLEFKMIWNVLKYVLLEHILILLLFTVKTAIIDALCVWEVIILNVWDVLIIITCSDQHAKELQTVPQLIILIQLLGSVDLVPHHVMNVQE